MHDEKPQDLEWLVRRARKGDQEAFSELVRRCQARVFSIALRITARAEDAQDITQEVFLKAYRSLAGFDTTRTFDAWLARIAVNCSYDALSRRRGSEGVSLDALFDANPGMWELAEDLRSGPEAVAERRQKLETLFRAMQTLPPKQRDAFVLKDLEGYETDEVAEIMDCDETTVRRHLSEARQKLRALLGESL